MSNYSNFSKATYAQGIVLDPFVREALHRVIFADPDGNKLLLKALRQPLTTPDVSPLAGVTNLDILTFNLDPQGGQVNLNQLPGAAQAGLDIIRFLGTAPVTIDTASFKGVVMLGGGSDSLTGTRSLAVQAGGGDDSIVTGAFNDTIAGGLGHDSIFAGGGNDNVIGGDGNDTINAGAGADTVSAGTGNDLVFGGAGHDTVFGGTGHDTLFGGSGNDRMFGGAGNDSMEGGIGDDILYTGGGSDTVKGGDGFDNLIVDASANGDSVFIDGGRDSDVLDLSKVVISEAVLVGSVLEITLDTGAVLNVTNVESFIYDNDGAANPGGKILVGLADFLADPDF
ncbi:MAG: hypothetical protein RL434_2122 [Pseudomonadota bacterium]|jgi:Ca2+-binding RTX toxin-like protein